jgi:hypothetical protein
MGTVTEYPTETEPRDEEVVTSEHRNLFDQEHVPTRLAVKIIGNGATVLRIEKLRRSSNGVIAFRATRGTGTRDREWSFGDLVRLNICWQLRAFLGHRERKGLWRDIPTAKIEEALTSDPATPHYMLITPVGTKIKVSFRSGDFQVGMLDLVINFGVMTRHLWRSLREVMDPWLKEQLSKVPNLEARAAAARKQVDRLQQEARRLMAGNDYHGARRLLDKARKIVDGVVEE